MSSKKKTEKTGESMEERVAALKNELVNLWNAMSEIETKLKKNHAQLIALLTKKFRHKITKEEVEENEGERIDDNDNKTNKSDSGKKSSSKKSVSNAGLKRL